MDLILKQVTMSSLDIVKVINAARKEEGINTELRHSDFLEKIKKVIPNSTEFSAQYKDSTGRTLPCFNLPKRESMLMAMSYSYTTQAKIYDRWQELENNKPITLPNNAQLAQMVIDESKRADEAIKTKAYISDKKTASAMGTASAAVKKSKKLEEELMEVTYGQLEFKEWRKKFLK